MADETEIKIGARKAEYEAGQLCPYCTADLALPEIGWYECGNCQKVFYADDTDSDYEDYHARRLNEMDTPPEDVKPARVLRMPEKSIKIGATISRATMGKLQAAHDALAELGACPADSTEMPDEMEAPDMEKSVVSMGGLATKCVKMEDGWHVRLPLVVFTNPNEPDLTGVDYFDQSTDFDMDFPGKSTAYFQHGMDKHFGLKRLKPVTLSKDEFAVWADGILSEVDEYEKFLIELGKAGKLGMSSGVPGHLVEREPVGKAMHIKYWPLGKDASYTHTPAEPKTRHIVPLKSLITAEPQEPLEVLALAASKTNQSVISEQENTAMTHEEIKALADMLREEIKRSEPATASAGVGRVEVTKDAADQPFKSLGEYFGAVKTAGLYPSQSDIRLRALGVKATGMSEGIPADGGYLIPPQYAAGILENMWNTGEILSRVSTDPVTGNSMTYNAIDETSRVDGSRMGGVRGYWLAEAVAPTKSAPKFRQVELKLKKGGALVYATDEQLEDKENLDSFINTNVPKELQFIAEDAIYEGDGVGKPIGITKSPCLISVLRVDANKIQYADILNMWARRKVGGKYVWYVNQDVTPQLDQLYLTSGIEGRFVGYGPDGVMTLKGAPVIEVEYAQTLGTAGDIVLADMNQYKVISKGGVKAESSIHVLFEKGEMTYRFTYRIDGAPLWASAVTPLHGTNTVSPFVTLSAASA